MSTLAAVRDRRPPTRTLVYWAAILNAQLLVVILYSLLVSGPPASLRGIFIHHAQCHFFGRLFFTIIRIGGRTG